MKSRDKYSQEIQSAANEVATKKLHSVYLGPCAAVNGAHLGRGVIRLPPPPLKLSPSLPGPINQRGVASPLAHVYKPCHAQNLTTVSHGLS